MVIDGSRYRKLAWVVSGKPCQKHTHDRLVHGFEIDKQEKGCSVSASCIEDDLRRIYEQAICVKDWSVVLSAQLSVGLPHITYTVGERDELQDLLEHSFELRLPSALVERPPSQIQHYLWTGPVDLAI